MKNIYTLLISLLMFSCSDDDPVLEPVEAMIVTNLAAKTTSGPGQPPAGDFVKFSFAKQTTVEGDDWDVAFRATTILVNGGFSGASDEPSRSGMGSGYVTVGNYGSIKSVEESLLVQDSETAKAIPTGSGNGWYNYDPQTYLITPIAGRTLVFKTHNGRYAKMEIQSYYKDSPENPNGFTSEGQTYTFNYTYQPNEGVTTFD
ncbi:MAG: hypothetical protein CMB87_01165 [Flammeovirgaceae bacterium]|nr:hypothetical protein [Flammeovirgaceae bacterium]|tara:strand:+ start:409 stop:1014 length:606 start_codon:yes stop_codon:yes gene_type:complete